MVNRNVDGYAKNLNNREILQKNVKNNLLKVKRTLKPKYKLSEGPVFTFSLPGDRFTLCPLPCQLRHWL